MIKLSQLIAFVIICNLIVVVTYFYRFFLRSPDPEVESDEAFTATPGITTDSLTTVDLVDLDMTCESDMRSMTEVTSSCFNSSAPSTQ